MASYSMPLKAYIESWSQDEVLSTREIIEKGRSKLFDFEYPIFDETYRKVFETHFIRHFYNREIGFGTEALFKFNLETWLLINMPYFNKLFESELIEFDPLVNSKMEVQHTKKNDSTQSQTTNVTGSSEGTEHNTQDDFNRNLESDNPDSRLSITTNDGEGVIEYAKSIEENKSIGNHDKNVQSSNTAEGQSNGTINETEDYIQSRTGKIGVQSYAKLINDYRDSFLRIENDIFKEMQKLFMLVY